MSASRELEVGRWITDDIAIGTIWDKLPSRTVVIEHKAGPVDIPIPPQAIENFIAAVTHARVNGQRVMTRRKLGDGDGQGAMLVAAWIAHSERLSVMEAIEKIRAVFPKFNPHPVQIASVTEWLLSVRLKGMASLCLP